MRNLIPKSLAKQKGIFYKNISWLDVAVILCEIGLSCACIMGITYLELWIRAIITIVMILILALFTMPYSKYNDVRFYKLWWYKIRFMVSNKKYTNTKDLNPYLEIKDNYLYTKKPKDGRSHYISMIKIRGLDISTLNEQEAKIKLDQFHSFLVQLKKHYSIAKINHNYSLSIQFKYLQEKLRQNKFDYDNDMISEKEFKIRKEQLNNQMNILENIQTELQANQYQSIFYLIQYDVNAYELDKNTSYALNELNTLGLFANQISSYDEINVIKNIFNPLEDDITNDTIDANRLDLDNIFNFESIEFKKDHLKINDNLLMSFYAISDYPTEVENYWLAFVFLSTNTNMILNAKQINQNVAISLLNKAIVNSASNQYNEKKQVQKMQFNAINEDFKKIGEDLVKQNQVVFKTNLLLVNYDIDYKSLVKTNKDIEKIFQNKSIKLNRLKYRQFEGLNSFLPKINDSLSKDLAREIPSMTIANGYPFINNSIDDDNGVIIGKNWLDVPIIFDQFKLDSNRKNHNMLVLGSSGSGKSYFTKKMINWFCMSNKKVFILDIEREYKDLTNNYDGNWIDIGSGTNGIINPLQIIPSENNLSSNEMILNHLILLETFFQILFNDISFQQLLYLTNLIKSFYFHKKFHLKDFSELSNNDWPIFEDIYKYAISNKNDIKKSYDKKDILYVHEILRSEFSNDGKLSFLYNKHTSINIDKDIACFDVNSLFEKNNQRIIQAQLFLGLNYIQNIIKDNDYTKKPITIVIDEAHVMIDEKNPIALDFIYQMSKRIRKRNGSIVIISQSPSDFISNDNVAKKTKAIINNTQYSLFFNLAPNDLKDVSEMFKSYGNGLTEDEKLYIAKAKQGQALFLVSGFDRHKINVYVSHFEKKIF